MSEAKLTILYLDDSEAQLSDACAALARQGYATHAATTLSEAFKKLQTADLVIIDYHMPDFNGRDAVEQLRKAVAKEKSVAFYLYTGDREVAVSYRTLGFDGAFVEKGDTAALVKQVQSANRMLQLKRLRNERRQT